MKDSSWIDHLGTKAAGILGDGSYRVFLTPTGGGLSAFEDYAVTAWGGPRAEHPQGWLLYLRDLDSGRFGLLGRPPAGEPATEPAGDDGTPRRLGVVELAQDADGLDCRLEICVPPGADLELRRLTVTNGSTHPRRIEITSYIETVLNQPAAHAAHPVFSKLFLQTERRPAGDVLVVRRRPRGSHERHPLLFHALAGAPVTGLETDRARFVGRGRNLRAPAALASRAPLSGSTGNILDPALSLRTVLDLEPGASARITYLLGAAWDTDRMGEELGRFTDPDRIETAFRKAGERAPRLAMAVPSFAGTEEETAGKPGSEGQQTDGADRRTGGASAEPLAFDNGYGGFSPDGTEYVIRVPVDESRVPTLPPRPWINIVANEAFGFMVSETGAGSTWSGNSREHRLTPWFNDPLLDPHGEALYLRDEDSGEFWSPCPGPTPAAANYEMRHGHGYSRCLLTHRGLELETTLFVPRHDPVKIQRVRLTNRSKTRRRLSLFAYYRLVLGGAEPDGDRPILTEYDPAHQMALAHRNPAADAEDGVAFAALVASDGLVSEHFTGDRQAFLGRDGDPSSPAAMNRPHLNGESGPDPDPCFAQQARFDLDPGATSEIVFLLGEAEGTEAARSLADRFRIPGAAGESLARVRRFWTESLARVRIETPSPALDLMVNGWLAYQTLACRIWGRSALYQSGGAFGFRDQLQDAASLISWWPKTAREQILRNAAHQFVEGDVLHWWHPPHSRGIRTRFADDLVWLPLLTAHYIRATGDERVLEESVPFIRARPLEPGEDEAYLQPEDSGETADLYEHCARALDRAMTRGEHGLPLFGGGDWNDGMNRVGREGRGESVWMGFFLYHTLGEFLPLCEKRGDGERGRRYQDYRKAVQGALETAGWDGDWYRRAYYDDGAALGSKENTECRIDALVQAWAVISQAAPRSRAERAMDAAERHLVSEDDGLIRLLTPPFDRTPRDPGYIKGYVPGVRENGGQYTHAAFWMVQAAALLGRHDRAARWLDMLNPIHHARNADEVAVYQVEPYVVCADVYGAPPHVGRGGWTWYTGSSGWMLRVALETILGFKLDGGERVLLEPRIPDQWPGFRLDYRFPDHETLYEITVTNPHGRARRVTDATLDGGAVSIENGAARIPVLRDGGLHRVEITLGSSEA